ncbi:MAG: hypothetical protein IPK82_07625 [Polyangiaceae bacterium]|nr:hypothetical protein [Polyangiaceae bacterium]
MLCGGARGQAAPPQFGLGITAGAAGVAKNSRIWDETVMHLGARGDLIFGRDGSNGFGIGPYAEVLTHDFGELQTGAGASFLIPVHELFPIVLSGGGYLRIPWQDGSGPLAGTNFGVEPGLAGTIFFGTRSFNFHNAYEITVGVIGQARFGLGESRESSFVVAAQIDWAALWVPWVFVIHGLQESPEAQRIK